MLSPAEGAVPEAVSPEEETPNQNAPPEEEGPADESNDQMVVPVVQSGGPFQNRLSEMCSRG